MFVNILLFLLLQLLTMTFILFKVKKNAYANIIMYFLKPSFLIKAEYNYVTLHPLCNDSSSESQIYFKFVLHPNVKDINQNNFP